ncbi:ATP-binding cassette sub-family A member 3-like [Contarinia nasturtii]|uniref:ATP-binding cassette sub-family A member 3-like n=1 Tax=Contarinia nasturtii TaxID=265458 RepID=UPI0012D3DB62|nr:ATP-binding cassette sub-family A member 3-like [Contarinia nasturtii]
MIRPMTPPAASQPNNTTTFGKIRLLLWKNWLLQKRHKIHTIVDVFLPVLFFVFFAFLQAKTGNTSHPKVTYRSLSIDSLEPLFEFERIIFSGFSLYPPIEKKQLIFTPNNAHFTKLLTIVSKKLQLDEPRGVSNSDELETDLVKYGLIAGIVFHHSNSSDVIPKSLSYSLRFPSELRMNDVPSHFQPDVINWNTNRLFPEQPYSPYYPYADDGKLPSYYKEGFLAIQNAIAQAFLQLNNVNKTMPDILLNRFPFPSYTENMIATQFSILLPLFFLLSLNYTFMNTIRFISVEKEKQLKEAMKIMGLAGWMHYLSWFIRTMIMLSISMILITILLTTSTVGIKWMAPVFPNSSFLCLIILFTGYGICLTTFGFVICAIFTQSKSAMTGSTIVWYLTSAPFFILNSKYDVLPDWLRLLSCICPNTAMSYGFKIISHLEQMDLGLNWQTVFQTTSIYDNLSVAKIFGIFMLTSIALFFIALYLENVLPGGYGVSKPWYFLCTKNFWQSLNNYQQFDNQHNDYESYEFPYSNSNKSNFESEPINKAVGIEIRNLTKQFKSDKAAVGNLSMNIYNNQITCLLGQNGAGKTTTISLLTGMMKPTSGSAVINGFDIRTNMDVARNSMGFCPQHNILFDELTVREHILFYCRLKGLSNMAAEDEIKKYCDMLELTNKMDTLSTALSGGMKRKLSVVIALCGGSKVVFLDEPTSGMDPGARRQLWDILLAEKKDRTILLTTHFMDEADVLSDRIAILANGELKCAGSTFFLKKRFGTGYHLICAKNDGCDSKAVTELLQAHIVEIRLEHENDTEISYILPEEKNDLFTEIFKDLELNESRLNLRSFGVSLTTLEEIFLTLGKSDKINGTHSPESNGSISAISDTRITLNDNHYLLHGVALWRNQAIAMFRKRFLCWIRAWHTFLYYNLFVIFVLSTVIFQFEFLFSNSNKLPDLEISFDKYKSPYAIVPFNASSELNDNITTQYKKYVEHSAKYLSVNNVDMQDGLLELANQSIKPFMFQYLTAISFNKNGSIVAWFNGQALHSAALAVNVVHNALVKLFLTEDHEINLQNDPLKFLPRNDTIPDILPDVDTFGYFFSAAIGIVMSVLSASYITFYIKEKEHNAKFMQYTSGAYLSIFWGASILWDLLTNTITICIIIIMLILGQHEHWKSPSELAIVFLILFVYKFAMIPIICLASLIFTKPTTGMNVISFGNIIALTVFSIETGLHFMNKFFYYILWAYPLNSMADGIIKLPNLHTSQLNCESACKLKFNTTTCDWSKWCGEVAPKCCSDRIFSWSDAGIGKNLVLMICTGLGAYVILLLIESGAFKFIRALILRTVPRTYPENDQSNLDDDVRVEKERIDKLDERELASETMVMQNVSKFYGQFCAVNQISVAIKRGECFGLLGKNGAGKSSIFKMLTGETMITNGRIYTQGYNQQSQLSDIYQIIGYCPQFDALLNGLTCRESLEIFALLRGIPPQDVRNYIENCARSLDFIQHIDKKVKQLSGGNKRKLSTSLAIIGNLSVIFLDEPTTGMDPATKRNLWNVVIQSREAGKSILLTSHSMEECEALCTRMTVLVNGLCKCLGSSQHLKNKFTKGFELKIKVKDDERLPMDIIEVKNFVLQTFSGAIFREEYQGILTYSVQGDNIKWSYVFSTMETAKKTLKIEDYSVSQTSLEQVVLALVKDQENRRDQE